MTDVVMSGDSVVMTPEDPTIAGKVVLNGVFLDHSALLSA